MRSLELRSLIALSLATALVAIVLPGPTEARERTPQRKSDPSASSSRPARPSAEARSSRPRATAAPRAKAGTRVRAVDRTQASGTATYGYYGQHVGYYGWYYPRIYSWYWGYPYYSWGWDPWYVRPGYAYVPAPAPEYRNTDQPAAVETDVSPKRAEVFVDGEYRGEARDFNGKWDRLLLAPGHRTVEFRDEGYQTLSLTLDIQPGAYYRIDERLARGEGLDARSIQAPSATEAPDTTARHDAEPAFRAEIEASDADGARSPALRRGLLRIEAGPADAMVYLDGEFLASAGELARLHGALPVAVGSHVIEVVRPGFAPERREVDVQGDGTVVVRMALTRGEGG